MQTEARFNLSSGDKPATSVTKWLFIAAAIAGILGFFYIAYDHWHLAPASSPTEVAHGTTLPNEFTFNGRVLNAVTGEPVANAFVLIYEGQSSPKRQVTDSSGEWSVRLGNSSAQLQIVVSMPGFKSATANMNPRSDSTQPIMLTPNPDSAPSVSTNEREDSGEIARAANKTLHNYAYQHPDYSIAQLRDGVNAILKRKKIPYIFRDTPTPTSQAVMIPRSTRNPCPHGRTTMDGVTTNGGFVGLHIEGDPCLDITHSQFNNAASRNIEVYGDQNGNRQ